MDEDIESLNRQLQTHRKNLRRLEEQAAHYGALAVPLEIQNRIDAEQEAINSVQSKLTAKQLRSTIPSLRPDISVSPSLRPNNAPFSFPRSRFSDYQPALPTIDTITPEEGEIEELHNRRTTSQHGGGGEALMGILVMILLVGWAINFAIYQLSIKFTDDFSYEMGLRDWKDSGTVSIVDKGRSKDRNTTLANNSTVTPASTPLDGAAELHTNPPSLIYHQIPTGGGKGEIYHAEVWCKAPIGTICKLYLGDFQHGLDLSTQGRQIVIKEGTEKWELMVVSFELEHDEQLYIFLYAGGQDGLILFDDVEVRRL